MHINNIIIILHDDGYGIQQHAHEKVKEWGDKYQLNDRQKCLQSHSFHAANETTNCIKNE